MKVHGNKDLSKKILINQRAIDNNKYVVRHSRMERLESGDVIEVPSSVRVGVYSPDDFENLFGYNSGRTGISVFTTVTGESVEVLHDPTIEKRGRKKSETEITE
jgi:hypothetical protein